MTVISDTEEAILATVNICTRNRAASLRRTLESIVVAADTVRDRWQLHVIDNGSSDETPDVVEAFSGRLPIQRISAPEPGLSNARNVGISHAEGRFIIWTDDDVVVAPGWLSAYLAVFREDSKHGIFGGRARPGYDAPQRNWFVAAEPYFSALLAIRDEPSWTTINADRLPWGLNYAVRTDLQKAFAYDPGLGVAPGRRRGGEETSMMEAALAGGATGRWIWDAEVRHMIPPGRQSLAYVFQYYRSVGFDAAPLVDISRAQLSIAGVPWRLFALVFILVVKAAMRFTLRDGIWVQYFVYLSLTFGNIDRYRRARSLRRTQAQQSLAKASQREGVQQ